MEHLIKPRVGLPTIASTSEVRRETVHAAIYETLRTPVLRKASDTQVSLHMRFGKLVFLLVYGLFLNLLFAGRNPHHWLNFYLTLVWTSYLPITLIGICGAFASRRQRATSYVGKRYEQVIFLIPTVARKDTLAGLCRVIDSILLCAPRYLPNFLVHVVMEEGAEGVPVILQHYHFHKHVQCIIVPKAYTPARGTRYKARANQYAMEYRRSRGLAGADVFVYHGDDDTSVGHDTMWSIAQFIERNTHDLAQGLLTYPHQLTSSWFCRLADLIRPADDLSRFYFCTGHLGSPLVGLHGEHLLIRASVEDRIGWDFGPTVKVEDAYFGLTFSSQFPRRSTFLSSCSYGASPASVRDLVTQRRRWAAGLVALLFDRQVSWKAKGILAYSITNWAMGLFQHLIVILTIAFLTGMFDTSPVLPIFTFCWTLNFAFQVWMYLEGLRINLEASLAPRWQFYVLPLVQVLSIPVLSFVEAWAALLGLLDFFRRREGFIVISKNA